MSPKKAGKGKGKKLLLKKRSYPKGKHKVEAGQIISLDEHTPHVEGSLLQSRVVKGQFGDSTLYDLESGNKRLTVGGSFILDQMMADVPEGAYVYITFTGYAGRAKMFDVSYD